MAARIGICGAFVVATVWLFWACSGQDAGRTLSFSEGYARFGGTVEDVTHPFYTEDINQPFAGTSCQFNLLCIGGSIKCGDRTSQSDCGLGNRIKPGLPDADDPDYGQCGGNSNATCYQHLSAWDCFRFYECQWDSNRGCSLVTDPVQKSNPVQSNVCRTAPYIDP